MTAVSMRSTTNELMKFQIANIGFPLSSSEVVFQVDIQHNTSMSLPCTAIVLVHRDTPTLWNSLHSLDWLDTIIVIDNNSQIAPERFTAASVTSIHPISDNFTDFAAVRNDSMLLVTTPWCFFLDSDEVVDPMSSESLASLEDAMQNQHCAALSCRRSDVFLGKKLRFGEAGRQTLIRFLRINQAHWMGIAHENPVVSGGIQRSQVALTHYSHESIKSFIEDVSVYAKIIGSSKMSSRTQNLWQLLFFPPLKLLYDLSILGGLLDGWRGITYSYCMALHSLLVRIYYYEKSSRLVSRTTTA